MAAVALRAIGIVEDVLSARRVAGHREEFGERRKRHGHDCEPVEEVLPELSAPRSAREVGPRRRDEALSAYRTASTLFGASSETHAAAARALVRLEK